MSSVPTPNSVSLDELPKLPGHTLGYIDSPSACAGLVQSLQLEGFESEDILTFQGPEGVELLTQMMKGSQWGESAETVLKRGTDELLAGHSIFCVKVDGDEEATLVASISTQLGGRSVTHFGVLVDTRLT